MVPEIVLTIRAEEPASERICHCSKSLVGCGNVKCLGFEVGESGIRIHQ